MTPSPHKIESPDTPGRFIAVIADQVGGLELPVKHRV
jgi:hypothetical protein